MVVDERQVALGAEVHADRLHIAVRHLVDPSVVPPRARNFAPKRSKAGFAAATAAAMTNMKTLLAAKPRLSEEKQIGLVGELLLFRTLLDSFDENTVIDWWLGPLAEERDYAFPEFDAEVKTTLGEVRVHVVHGAGQLEPSPGRALWLVSIQVTRAGGDPNGVTLPGLIGEIRDRLATARDRFVAHLASVGWDEDDYAMYPAAAVSGYYFAHPQSKYFVVGKIGEEEVFYLMSRGLSHETATRMIVSGFVEPIVRSLPLEYAVELNKLIELEMEGSVG